VENANSVSKLRASRKPNLTFSIAIGISLFVSMVVVGCGAPGEPSPPAPPIASAVTDLAARQVGDGAELTFTLPARTVSGDRLTSSPAVEILRGVTKPDGSPDAKSFHVVDTIPGALVENYSSKSTFEFIDSIPPEETKAHPGASVAYRVRTRLSQKRASADSNTVIVRVFSVPERISSIEAHVAESAIELNWSAPTRTSAGDSLAGVSGYRLYRGELDPAAAASAADKDPSKLKWLFKPTLLASPDSNSYQDMAFEFGKTYGYIVRSVILVESKPIESGDSVPTVITPVDIFPPAPPKGLIAAVLPGSTSGSVLVDLSWSISPETDLAGYRVYRSEQQDTRGQLLNPELLPTPAVRDNSVQPGHRYWYSVTAVDRAGNESAPSALVVVDVAQPSQ
jgi:hypothetical protein